MPLSTFDRALPLSGALAGILFAMQEVLAPFGEDVNDAHLTTKVAEAVGRGYAAGFASLVGGVLLLFFAAAARSTQRSGEPAESSYSSVAHAGLVGAGMGLAFQGYAQVALTSAAHDGQEGAARTLMYLSFYAWLMVLAGLAAAFWAIGLGALRNATLPRWFAVVTIVLGCVALLGPLGAVVQLVLPAWLVAATVVTSLAQRSARRTGRATGVPA